MSEERTIRPRGPAATLSRTVVPCGPHRTGCAHLRHRAVQHPVGLDDPDAAGRRLPVRLQILLRLQQAFLPFSLGLFSGRIFAARPSAATSWCSSIPGPGQGYRTDYIKRIVGLPGDRIQVMNGILHINGKPVGRAADRRLRAGRAAHQTRHALQRGAAQRPALTRSSRRATTERPTTRRSSWCPPTTTS